MKITKTSQLSGQQHTLDIPITSEQYLEMCKPLSKRGFVQDICPNLDDGLREFLMTGITPDEWNATFKDE